MYMKNGNFMMAGIAAALGAASAYAAGLNESEWFHRSNEVYSVFEAVNAGDATTLAQRLSEGDTPNARNEQGDTPLHLAAAAGAADTVRLLVKSGGDPLAKNAAGQIPSEVAADDATRAACREGEAMRMRELELFALVRENRGDELKAAMAGLNPNALSADGTHPLLAEAVQHGALRSAVVLIEAGANPGYTMANSKTLLHLAAALGRVRCIYLLMASGADPMASSNNGALPIHEAIWTGQTAAAIALIPAYRQQGYNPNGRQNGYPITMAIRRGNADVVKALLEAGVNPNDPLFAREPLLVLAAQQKSAAIVQLLLEAGADKDARDAAGKTARDYATGAVAELLNRTE